MPPAAASDSWKRLVLGSMPLPAWLKSDGPHRAVVLSTRVRCMRNLRGHMFPLRASIWELREVEAAISSAIEKLGGFEIYRSATPPERDYFVACRLASPDLDLRAPGRALALDQEKCISAMINEEDHLRLQALAPGWSLSEARRLADRALAKLEAALDFSKSDRFGWLAACPANAGEGLRYSAMFHLIGLANARRLGEVIRALTTQGLVVRGLFGERSRAIGAFLQVSTTEPSLPQFVGACDHLIEEELRSRKDVSADLLERRIAEAKAAIQSAQSLSLADALRLLAWLRWAASSRPGKSLNPREIDGLIPELALLESLGDPRAGKARAASLRTAFDL